MVDLASAPAERQREVRLGLVMYGGVSLAIYINGVTREFFRAVHGNGVYKLLKRLTDSDIVVDIVSGTSAGGINGIFLAFALANGRDFGTMSNLWREYGDLRKLLRDPDDMPDDVNSVLDSEGFYQPRLEEAFAQMYGTPYTGGGVAPGAKDEPSRMNELDLFVTSTNIDGVVMTVHDDRGHLIDVKEHRAVFQLKHRSGRKEPFNPEDNQYVAKEALWQALARLSRMTSCFPAAFAPVEVKVAAPGWRTSLKGNELVDACAQESIRVWGRLQYHSYFLDGGVLDNKPFTFTIRDMAYRLKDREIERVMFYVEPDPETFERRKEEQAKNIADRPTFMRSAMAGAMTIPSYESIASDLQLLAEYNANVQQYDQVCLDQETKSSRLRQPARSLEELESDGGWQGAIYVRSRLVQISDRVTRGLLRVAGFDAPLQGDERDDAEVLVRAFHEHPERATNTLARFDVYFRQRRLLYVADSLRHAVKFGEGVKREECRSALRAVNRAIKLLEIVRFWMERLVDEKPFPWRPKDGEPRKTWPIRVWDEVKRAYQDLLAPGLAGLPAKFEPAGDDVEKQLSQDALNAIHKAFKARYDAIDVTKLGPPAETTFTTLLDTTDAFEQSLVDFFAQTCDAAKHAYDEFNEIDLSLFPIQFFSQTEEREHVKVSRISPADAQLGFAQRELTKKVAGDVLGHFGGFLKRAWRSNDILWGRLDTVSEVLDALLTEERIRDENNVLDPSIVDEIDDAFLAGCFPHATQAQRAKLLAAIANRKNDLDRLKTLLVEHEQLEILYEEVPRVLADEELERQLWENPRRDTAVVRRDIQTKAEEFVTARTEPADSQASPAETVLGRYFLYEYKVGEETVADDIDPLIRIDTVFSAARVAKEALVNSAKKASFQDALRGSGVYQFLSGGLDILGRYFGAAASGARTSLIVQTVVLTAALALMIIGFLFRESLLYTGDAHCPHLDWGRIFIFFGVPLIALLVVWLIGKSRAKYRKRLKSPLA